MRQVLCPFSDVLRGPPLAEEEMEARERTQDLPEAARWFCVPLGSLPWPHGIWEPAGALTWCILTPHPHPWAPLRGRKHLVHGCRGLSWAQFSGLPRRSLRDQYRWRPGPPGGEWSGSDPVEVMGVPRGGAG